MINRLGNHRNDGFLGVPGGGSAPPPAPPPLDPPAGPAPPPLVITGYSLGDTPAPAPQGDAAGAVRQAVELGLSPETALAMLMFERYKFMSSTVTERMGDMKLRGQQANHLRELMNAVRSFRSEMKTDEARPLTEKELAITGELKSVFGVSIEDCEGDKRWNGREMDRLVDVAQGHLDTMTSDDQMAMQMLMRSYQKMDECVSALSTRAKAWHESADSIIRNGA